MSQAKSGRMIAHDLFFDQASALINQGRAPSEMIAALGTAMARMISRHITPDTQDDILSGCFEIMKKQLHTVRTARQGMMKERLP